MWQKQIENQLKKVEQELHTVRLEDHDHHVSKVVSIVRKLINAIDDHNIATRCLTSECISEFCNNSCCKDCRMDVRFFLSEIIKFDQQ